MGMFTKGQQVTAESIWEKAKPYLVEKDGNVHIVMFNSFSKFINQVFGCEDKYTTEIGTIVDLMQKAGYEIVDIKFNSIQGQGLSGQLEGFHTLIMYK